MLTLSLRARNSVTVTGPKQRRSIQSSARGMREHVRSSFEHITGTSGPFYPPACMPWNPGSGQSPTRAAAHARHDCRAGWLAMLVSEQ